MPAHAPRGSRHLPSFLLLLVMGQLSWPSESSAQEASRLDPQVAEAAREWVAESAIELATVEAGNGFEDLEPLRQVLAGVRVVGLGEATHGTREIFQCKHRFLEFLVAEMGFTLFAIEASFPACLNVNRYVLFGEGDPAQAQASMGFWTWDTQEVAAMIEWIRTWNQAVPEHRQVRFLGYDIQYIDGSLDAVEEYLERVAPEYLETARAAFEAVRIDSFEIAGLSRAPEEEKLENARQLEAVVGLLALHEAQFVRETSRAEFDWALQHARIPAQFHDAYSRPMFDPDDPAGSAAAYRDLYMARNIEWLLTTAHPGAKMAVWAHNGHVSTDVWGGIIPAMGWHLRRVFGDAYYTLGFDFHHGSFQARHLDPQLPDEEYGVLRAFEVGSAAEGSMADHLSLALEADYVLDLRSLPDRGPVRQFFSSPLPMSNIGAGFSERTATQAWRNPVVALEHYDGLVFLQETTRARPTPTGTRGPIPKQSVPGG